jgi:hypothetical protein
VKAFDILRMPTLCPSRSTMWSTAARSWSMKVFYVGWRMDDIPPAV